VGGKTYSKKECYQRSLEFNPMYASAWYNLGCEGGGNVGGKNSSEKECKDQYKKLEQGS